MKKQIILVLGLLIAGALQAQEKGNYINLTVGGGYHNLSYTFPNGTEKEQVGYTLDAGYSYFFTRHWGIHTGVGVQTYNSLSTLNYLSNTPDVDTDGQSYDFRANYTNYQEKQQAILIDIPLALQYRLPIGTKFALQASVGAKVSLPFQSTFKTVGGQLVTTGYYSVWDVELSDMPQHGFATMTGSFSGNTALKTAYMGIADLGGLIKLSHRLDLYIGGYVNYGLNNVITPDSKLIYQPNGTYNGLFASSQTNKVIPVAYGAKVGFSIRLGKMKHNNDHIVPAVLTDSTLLEKQVLPVDSLNTKRVIVKEEVYKQSPKGLRKFIRNILTKPTGQKAKVDPTLPVESFDPSGSTLPGNRQDSLNGNGRFNSGQINSPFERAKKIASSMSQWFDFDSYEITNANNVNTKELSDILKANPDILLIFVGYTCNIGTQVINIKLGMKRVESVIQKFLEQGVPESQLIGESKGYDQPLVPNTSAENRALNRRVEIKVIKDY